MNDLAALPAGLTPEELVTAMNRRIYELNAILKGAAENPATKDLAMAYKRIVALGDPQDDLDAVNLRYLRRFAGSGSQEQQSQQAPVAASGFYTIVLSKDGFVSDEELTPYFTVNDGRIGKPYSVSVTCVDPPSIGDLTINVQVGGQDVLAEVLTLSQGSTGPVRTSELAYTGTIPDLTNVQGVILTGGGAGRVTIEMVVRLV